MRYEEYLQKTSLTQEELLGLAWGTLVDDPVLSYNGSIYEPDCSHL